MIAYQYLVLGSGWSWWYSNDWASMVMEMYKAWAQRRGYQVSVVDEMAGDIAGIKVCILNLFF